jgi:hypothetical protein
MEYNSQRPTLVLPEHGRNVHQMVNYAKNLETREERTKAIVTIVNMIAQMNPSMKDQTEFQHKLWDHMFIIADYDLDVDSPFPPPKREEVEKKPDRLPYPVHKIRYKHYGKNVELMIQKAIEMPSGQEKDYYVNAIASYMKVSYRKWNDEKVSDQVILDHLEELSNGYLKLDKIIDLHKMSDNNQGGGGRYNNKNSGKPPHKQQGKNGPKNRNSKYPPRKNKRN